MPTIRSRTSAVDGHIIITGTGRAGTTYLVQLFSALGFDTGFSVDQALAKVDSISNSGLERPLVSDNNPYVLKSPWYADTVAKALKNQRIKIYTAIIPMRDLVGAADSRRRVYVEAAQQGLNPLSQPGSIWHTWKPAEQEGKLAEVFYKAIFPLIRHEVPVIFLEFPRFVREPDYLLRALAPVMDAHGVDRAEFLTAHHRVARPDRIHDLKGAPLMIPRAARTVRWVIGDLATKIADFCKWRLRRLSSKRKRTP